MQVRFWTYQNGNVRLKMRPGETFRHYWFATTDEGWSSEAIVYRFDGCRVYCEIATDGVDCDGRLSSYSESFFDALDATKGYQCESDKDHKGNLIRYPEWQEIRHGQRDYSAEAMGY